MELLIVINLIQLIFEASTSFPPDVHETKLILNSL